MAEQDRKSQGDCRSEAAGELEFRSPRSMGEVQDRLLVEHLRYVAARSPYYRKIFDERGFDVNGCSGAGDLRSLPFTGKDDIAASPGEFLSVDEEEIVDLCLTSGTTGAPVAMLQTKEDLERLGYNEEVSFRSAGIDSGDRVLVAAAIDRCFRAGLAYFLGLNRIGAMVIRGGSSSPAILAEFISRHRPTALVGVPTLFSTVADVLAGGGEDPAALGVERIVCIGEPVRKKDLRLSALGARLKERWGAGIYGTYASTELATAFCDCPEGAGGHLHPDLTVLEIVDDDGRPVPAGEEGEVVVTPLQVKGMPLVRFRTGDIAALHLEPCRCGRNSPRLGPVTGRKSQMLKYRGTTLYPQAIFSVLQEIEEVKGYYLEVHREFELSDRIRVVVGSAAGRCDPAYIAEKIAARTRVKPEVEVVEPAAVLARTTREGKRKAQTFFDCRGRNREET